MGEIQGTDAVVQMPVADANTAATVALISDALKASGVVTTKTSQLYEFDGRIDSTAPTGTYYIQVYKNATVPADGVIATLLLGSPIKVMHTTGLDTIVNKKYSDFGGFSAAGLSWALSSTEFTKTITTAYAVLDFFYKIDSTK